MIAEGLATIGVIYFIFFIGLGIIAICGVALMLLLNWLGVIK